MGNRTPFLSRNAKTTIHQGSIRRDIANRLQRRSSFWTRLKQQQNRLRGTVVSSYPAFPSRPSWIFVTLALLKIRLVTYDTKGPRIDMGLNWRHESEWSSVKEAYRPDVHVINDEIETISKDRIDELHESWFGHGLSVDPTVYSDSIVVKPKGNALGPVHVEEGPIDDLDPDMVYQRFVKNYEDGRFIDYRFYILRGQTKYIAKGYWELPPGRLKVNCVRSLEVSISEYGAADVTRIEAFVRSLGVEFAAVDVVRDRSAFRDYVVDINPTAFQPRYGMSRAEQAELLARLSIEFAEAYFPAA